MECKKLLSHCGENTLSGELDEPFELPPRDNVVSGDLDTVEEENFITSIWIKFFLRLF